MNEAPEVSANPQASSRVRQSHPSFHHPECPQHHLRGPSPYGADTAHPTIMTVGARKLISHGTEGRGTNAWRFTTSGRIRRPSATRCHESDGLGRSCRHDDEVFGTLCILQIPQPSQVSALPILGDSLLHGRVREIGVNASGNQEIGNDEYV
jgi:hypothetical protein